MKAHEFCVYGYSDENTLRVNTLNSSGQSTVIYFDNNILIARPLCQNRTNMSPQAEINRRKDAIALYQQHLPEFTPKTELAIFQGEHIETKTTFPILGRFTTKFENVIPLTKLTDNQVVNNPYICESLAKISLFSLGMFLTQGKIVDPGRCGTFGCSLPPLFAKIARTLVTDNTMISTNESGNLQIICDPDWYNYFWENKKISAIPKTIFKTARVMALRAIFFNGLNLYHKTKTKFDNYLVSIQSIVN